MEIYNSTLSFPEDHELDHNDINLIVETLNRNRYVKTLDFRYNFLDDERIELLLYDVFPLWGVTTFDFGYNFISDRGAENIAILLKDNNISLETLNLRNNGIGDEGAEALADMLKVNISLKTLNLKNNEIGYSGVKSLLDALDINNSLTTLKLNGNTIDTIWDTVSWYKDIIEKIEEKLKENRRRELFILLELIRKEKIQQGNLFWKGIPKE